MPNSSENDATPQWVMGDLPGQTNAGRPAPDEAQEAVVQEGGQPADDRRAQRTTGDSATEPVASDSSPAEKAAKPVVVAVEFTALEAFSDADGVKGMGALLAAAEEANAAALALAHAQADAEIDRIAAVTPLLEGVLDALLTEFDALEAAVEVPVVLEVVMDERLVAEAAPEAYTAEAELEAPVTGGDPETHTIDDGEAAADPEIVVDDAEQGVSEADARMMAEALAEALAEAEAVAALPELSAQAERPVESGPSDSHEAAEAQPAPAVTVEKPRKRSKRAREPKPAAPPVEAAEAVEALSQAAGGHVVTMGPAITNGHLNLEALVESLLFVADGAVPVARLAEALEIHPREAEAALAALAASYQHRGLSLQRFRDRVQLTTAPAAAALVERFLGLAASTPLSRAALEALAIIAYQQPVTRPHIEAVRGVNSDSVIKNLLTKGLIEESGRAEGPGRPVLYSTTSEFMQHFGLATLGDLPPLTPPAADSAAEKPSAEYILNG